MAIPASPSATLIKTPGDAEPAPSVPSKTEAETAAQTAKQNLQEIANTDAVKVEAQTTVAEKVQKRLEGDPIWMKILKDPKQALMDEITKVFPGDSDSKDAALSMFNGMVSGQMDPESSLAAYSSTSTPDAYSGPAVVSGSGSPLVSRSFSPIGKEENGSTPCARSILIGTATTIARMSTGLAGKDLKGIAAIHQTVAAMAANSKEIMSTLMTFPVDRLQSFLADKKTLLEQIRGYIGKVYETAFSFTYKDYGYKHQQLLRQVLNKLTSADSSLNDVERVLLAGGNFLQASWDSAEKSIDAAADLLHSTQLEMQTPNKQLALIGYMSMVNTSMQVLLCRQAFIEQIYSNLSKFTANFSAYCKVDNLFGPILDQIQCILRRIRDEVASLCNNGTAFKCFLKEKQWYTELKVLLAFMNQAEKMGQKVTPDESADTLSTSLSADEGKLNKSNDFTTLANLIEEFKRVTISVMCQPVDVKASLTNLYKAILVEIDRQVLISEETDKKLKTFGTSLSSKAVEVSTMAASLATYLQDLDLGGMLSAIKNGDLRKFFSASARRATPEQEAMSNVATVLRYAEVNMPGEVGAITAVYTNLRGKARSKELYKKATLNTANEFIKDQKKKELAKDNASVKVLDRLTNRLRPITYSAEQADLYYRSVNEKIDMVSGKVESVQSSITETMERAGQKKPVSCAAR